MELRIFFVREYLAFSIISFIYANLAGGVGGLGGPQNTIKISSASAAPPSSNLSITLSPFPFLSCEVGKRVAFSVFSKPNQSPWLLLNQSS